MKHRLAFVMLFALYSTIPVQAQYYVAKEKLSVEMQSFYRHPSPELLHALILGFDNDKDISENPSAQWPLLGFFVTSLSQYKEDLLDYITLSDSLKNIRTLIQYSLVLTQVKDTILNWKSHEPATNDLLWGAFFASGDTTYLARLVSEMGYCDEKDSLMLYLTGASAKWSLCSNAGQYSEVKHYLEIVATRVSNPIRRHVLGVLQSTPGDLRQTMFEDVSRFKKK